MTECFHCGEPVPLGENRTVRIDGRDRPVCCPGCEAVAGLIAGAGLTEFYRFRAGAAPTPAPDSSDEWSAFDRDAVQAAFVRALPDGHREALLAIEGMYCAACAWLIERMLGSIAGVEDVQVNPATGRAQLRWDPDQVALSRLLRRMNELGYGPQPLGTAERVPAATRERRAALKRLAVAGLGMMQVMMYAVGLYAGAIHSGMDPEIAALLRGVSLLIATPVVFYAAAPFFRGAWRDLRSGRPGMDVPVALAIGGAYAASTWNTLIGSGEVYFDSVAMFVFLLSVARYFEMSARHRATDTGEALARTLPATVLRLGVDGTETRITLAELAPGDRVRVRPGESVPADGRVRAGEGRLDESLLTGEFMPVRRAPGDEVLGGSINITVPIEIEVERVGQATLVANIVRMLERAQSQRPGLARTADRIARWFVGAVLLLAAVTAIAWWQIAPGEAFAVTLAVLVVTCPCALSLATPAALVAATSRLAREGVLVARSGALETLARADRIVFDKTGTLTTGELTLQRTEVHADLGAADAHAYAAALEAHSEHPLARAFVAQSVPSNRTSQGDVPGPRAVDLRVEPGHGIEGTVDGRRLRIGRPDWVAPGEDRGPVSATHTPAGLPGHCSTDTATSAAHETRVALGDGEHLLATFHLADTPRPDAVDAIAELRQLGVAVEIASGDAEQPVAALARTLAIDEWRARQLPGDKLARLQERQRGGERVIMVGDGINDAPVLAGADVSIAMGAGSALAQSSADMVLTGERLAGIGHTIRTARRTLRVVRQNLAWAVAYNALALPLAVSGQLAPWMAALGMSASSLIVVSNAMRLGRGRGSREERARADVGQHAEVAG
jgi:Cu2+-exporting ATPase